MRQLRQFIVLGHTVPIEPDFTLNDLPGSAGRLDVLCRCVNAAFFLSHDLRHDVQLYLVIQDELVVRFDGSTVQYLNPDERSTAALIQKALEKAQVHPLEEERESTPGIHVSRREFSDILQTVDGTVLQLHEDGDPLETVAPVDDPVFVLSDHEDFSADEQALLDEYTDARVRIGPRTVHADHAITIVHNRLDRL